jgi:hypothetical protein
MSAEIIPLFDDPVDTDELDRLWEDFLDKREKCLVVDGHIQLFIEAGTAFGALMRALGQADKQSKRALAERAKRR